MVVEKLIYFVAIYFGLFTSIFFLLTYFENIKRLKNPKVRRYPKVSIAVSMYNAAGHLPRTVESLLALDWPKNKLEIIIIDDGSTDDSYKSAKKYTADKRVQLLKQEENRGKSVAVNRALKLSTGEYFGVLDVDSFVTKDCLKKMMGYFENEKVMSVTPSLKIYGVKTWLQRVQMIEYLVGVYLRKVFSYLGAVHVTPGCFSIYRKAFFNETGLYDEKNLTEDIEIACRIQCKDYKIENAVDANVYTTGHKKIRELSRQRLRWYKGFLDNIINYKRIFHTRYGNLGLFVLPSAFVSVGLAILLAGFILLKLGQSFFDTFNVWRHTGFDVKQYFNVNLDIFYINMNGLLILGLLALVFSFFVLKLINRHSKENRRIILSFILFIFVYVFLYAFWWISAGYYRLLGKKIHWGSKYL